MMYLLTQQVYNFPEKHHEIGTLVSRAYGGMFLILTTTGVHEQQTFGQCFHFSCF